MNDYEEHLHKDGRYISFNVEGVMEFIEGSRDLAIWWMTQTSRNQELAQQEIFQLLKIPDHPDRKYIEACAVFLIKERLTS